MSSLDDSQGIGGGNAGDDNPFSLPESDFVDDASNNETAGQRVGLGHADAASEQGSADEAGLQAEQPDSSDSGNADLKHDVAPSSGRTDSTDNDTCDDKDTSGAHRTSNARSNGSGQQEERAYSSPAQQSDSQPSPENSTPDQVEEQAKLPLDRVIQRGEQIGAGRDPMTGKPDTDRKTWTEADKQAAWDNADIVPGEDKTKVRQDAKGDVMHRDDYGKNKTSENHWQVDHHESLHRGGDNQHSNLQAMTAKNNNAKSSHVQMRHGDEVSFQDVPMANVTQDDYKDHDNFIHDLNSGQLGKNTSGDA